MGKNKVAKVQVPECRYGAACTRRDCVFRHPPKPVKSERSQAVAEKSDKVCFAFIAGKCAFGRQCHDRHPDEETCHTIRERYAKVDCQWGRVCRTEGCLYRHPTDEIVGPALVIEPKPQPAVYAHGQKTGPAANDDSRPKGWQSSQMPYPKSSSSQASGSQSPNPIERFHAEHAGGAISQRERPPQPVRSSNVLDGFIPDQLTMFRDGVWAPSNSGPSQPKASGAPIFDGGAWPNMPSTMSTSSAHNVQDSPSNQEPDDSLEWARHEQLAATLRCMGFDEEFSLQAAQRSGGNLNRAVEDVLHQRRSAG